MDGFGGSIDLGKMIDRRSFMLGMMTAFAECVAGECKRCAFSSPFYPDDYHLLKTEAERIAEEQGLSLFLEENTDIAEENRVYWWVMYKYPEVLDQYKEIRKKGWNPALEFDEFREFLSYGTVWGENSEQVIPKMRKKETIMNTVARILFHPGDWPISPAARLKKNG